MQGEYYQLQNDVDSYTKLKAQLFSAYLQNEMTHDICVQFKLAAQMKSKLRWSIT
jgi:hypothetical protein